VIALSKKAVSTPPMAHAWGGVWHLAVIDIGIVKAL